MKLALLLIFLCAAAAIAADDTTRPDVSIQEQPTTRRAEFNYGGRNRRERRYERQTDSPQAASALPAITEEVGGRNIFVRGNQRSLPPQPAPPSLALPYNYTSAPNQLVLTGVSLADFGRVAFLEDEGANTVDQVKIGDSIAAGKITGISLDSLDYRDSTGRTIRVAVGFNLAGGDVWGASSSTSSSSGASTQPSRVGPRAPGESMEDYLKRRRAEELAH